MGIINPDQFGWNDVAPGKSMTVGDDTVHQVSVDSWGDSRATEVVGLVTKTPSGRYSARADRYIEQGRESVASATADRDYRTPFRARVAGAHLINQVTK